MTPRRATVLIGALTALLALLAGTATSGAGAASVAARSTSAALTVPMSPPTAQNPSNPLAGRDWGVYRGNADPAWPPYVAATGTRKERLGVIALAPKAKYFGAWIPDSQILQKMTDYIENATGGDPRVLVQFTLFRMVPWEGEACRRLPTQAERRSYRRYINRVAAAVGDTHAAIVLQPDGPFLDCVPRGSDVPARLLRYSARTLSALPNTAVYLEMGSADWFRDKTRRPVRMLLDAGVGYTRGFALNASHFDSVGRQIRFGRRIVNRLADRGVPGRHFVVDTVDSGRPFTGEWFHRTHPGTPLSHAAPCERRSQRRCVALGVPPTTDVANPAWGLTDGQTRAARRHVDGYLWISRPWLVNQSGGFSLDRALKVVRFSPFQ